MYYMDFIIAVMGVQGGKVSILQKSQLLKNCRFWLGYSSIKLDKTGYTASILIQFQTLVVKTLLKQKINIVVYYLVKKVVFEQLKFYN